MGTLPVKSLNRRKTDIDMNIIIQILWQFRFLILLGITGLIIWFGYNYIQKLSDNYKDAKAIATTAIKEHDRVVSQYSQVNIALTDNEKAKQELEMENEELKLKLRNAINSSKVNKDWANSIIPSDIIGMLSVQKGSTNK